MEDGRNRRNGAQVHRIERVLSENTTMGPRFSNRNAVLNPKSNLKVRSKPRSKAQRRLDELQRGPIAPFSAITGLPCHNRLSGMLQQAKKGPFVSQARVHGPWPMDTGHDLTIQQPHSPMVPLATIVLRSYSPKAQVQSCPTSLGISPSPTLRINLALPGTKNISQMQKSHPAGWLFCI